MKTKTTYTDILELFRRVVNKYRSLEKAPIPFGTGDSLFRQEVSAIQAIGADPGKNVSELAQILGVTKGTASPIVTRLAKRGLVTKYKNADNNKEVLLDLTIRGKSVYHENELLLIKLRQALFDRYEKEKPEYLEFLKEFLAQMEVLIEEHYAELHASRE